VNSNHHNPHPNSTDVQPDPDATDRPEVHWWARMVDRINAWWMHREPAGAALRDLARIVPAPAIAGFAAVAGTVVAVVGVLAWWLISALAGIASAVADTTHHAARTGTQHAAAWSLTRTITDPVRTCLDQHATGLPVSPHVLWLTWLASTGGLFIAATLGSRGARIGWTLTGAATTAMVYTATPHPGRALAAGLAVTAWSVLSIAAFNRATIGSADPIDLTIIRRRPTPTASPGTSGATPDTAD
jgi:hypothetical protein